MGGCLLFIRDDHNRTISEGDKDKRMCECYQLRCKKPVKTECNCIRGLRLNKPGTMCTEQTQKVMGLLNERGFPVISLRRHWRKSKSVGTEKLPRAGGVSRTERSLREALGAMIIVCASAWLSFAGTLSQSLPLYTSCTWQTSVQ